MQKGLKFLSTDILVCARTITGLRASRAGTAVLRPDTAADVPSCKNPKTRHLSPIELFSSLQSGERWKFSWLCSLHLSATIADLSSGI